MQFYHLLSTSGHPHELKKMVVEEDFGRGGGVHGRCLLLLYYSGRWNAAISGTL